MRHPNDNLARKRVLLTSDIPMANPLAKDVHDARNKLGVLICALPPSLHPGHEEEVEAILNRIEKVDKVTTALLHLAKSEELDNLFSLALLEKTRGRIRDAMEAARPYIDEEWREDVTLATNEFEEIIEAAYQNLKAESEEIDDVAPETELMSISDYLPHLISEYQHQYPHIKFSIFASPAASSAECPSSMKRSIENLLLNAVQAMPPSGGRITATLECREIAGQEKPFEEIDEGCYLSVEIEDNGSGIPPDVLEHLEHESYTTKSSGSGLGLVSARETMRAHNSHLYIESAQGKGTRVTALIPSSIPPGPPRTISGVRKKVTKE